VHTPDLGGTATTSELAQALADRVVTTHATQHAV
jgi:hypothetical protein